MRYGSQTAAGATVQPTAPRPPAIVRALGSVDDPATTDAGEPSIWLGLGALGVTALGGAFTGYVAAGDGRGAATGALVHTTLVGLGTTLVSVNTLPAWKTITYGVISLAAGVGAAVLFVKRPRRR